MYFKIRGLRGRERRSNLYIYRMDGIQRFLKYSRIWFESGVAELQKFIVLQRPASREVMCLGFLYLLLHKLYTYPTRSGGTGTPSFRERWPCHTRCSFGEIRERKIVHKRIKCSVTVRYQTSRGEWFRGKAVALFVCPVLANSCRC